jgi:CIC family chloride channel protein
MLAEGIAFVALRNRSLYHAQVATKRESPAHRDDFMSTVLRNVSVADVMLRTADFVAFERNAPASEVTRKIAASEWQDAFPVLVLRKLKGIISADVLRTMTADPDLRSVAIADDMMQPPIVLRETDTLQAALDMMLSNGMRELVVVDGNDEVIGFLDEAEIARVYRAEGNMVTPSNGK